ncbi:DUF732 domain-containing protein [Actinomadura rubrisoli]|uniref:Uncharacterized protein n=1 Tax=Actinomadura rubrisoli TaxID=2530368 RepID=A0A4R5BIC7_9ACTN|nr:DUF732 domain-containing protein [Actinomadura rubrisoli]TDD83482.1 hypothetical protein E1298_21275 [Actinomadura rubrisoli]
MTGHQNPNSRDRRPLSEEQLDAVLQAAHDELGAYTERHTDSFTAMLALLPDEGADGADEELPPSLPRMRHLAPRANSTMRGLAVAALSIAAPLLVLMLFQSTLHTRPAAHVSPLVSTAPARPASSAIPRPVVPTPQPEAVGVPRMPPPPPRLTAADQRFLDVLDSDGISAPDEWAIEAGRYTCGIDYSSAYRYLTDGGLHGHHVRAFLNEWRNTHAGCDPTAEPPWR